MLGIIGLGGNCNYNEALKKLIPDEYYAIAADSGLAHFLALGIKPDLLVGDLDSVDDSVLEHYIKENLEIIKYDSRKNQTDSEIAVDKALTRGCDSLLFIGAFGSRLDHSLSNQMMAVSLANAGIPCVLTDGATRFYTITKSNSPFKYYIGDLKPGVDVISLVPMFGDAVGVTEEGLEYRLAKETILFGSTKAVSNTVPAAAGNEAANTKADKDSFAAISVESGTIFFIHTKSDEFLKQ
jgi:thiamine pyrophosphokinase